MGTVVIFIVGLIVSMLVGVYIFLIFRLARDDAQQYDHRHR